MFGSYRIVKTIGRGNNGIVYLAHQEMLDRLVACKILDPEEGDPAEYAEAFFREARTAAKMSHPNIVQALDVGKVDNYYFFIMEFVDGKMLEFIRENSPELLSPEFLTGMGIKLANALNYAWQKHRIVHGDIKPANIIVNLKNGTPKLADLGVARIAGNPNSQEIMATPLYVAPEVIISPDSPPDPRSDIYSFGVMLYELYCGEPPFDAPLEELLQKHIYETPVPLLKRNPDMNVKLAAFIDRMLKKNISERPQSWLEVEQTLAAIEAEMSVPTTATPPAENPAEQNFFAATWFKVLLAVLGGVIAGLIVLLIFDFTVR